MRSIFKRGYRGSGLGVLYKKNVLMFCAFLVYLSFLSACSEEPPKPKPSPVDKVVATVDGRPIMRSTLDRALKLLLYQGEPQKEETQRLDDEELKGLIESALNGLIEEEIVIDQARKQGIKIIPQELAETISLMTDSTESDTFDKEISSLYGSLDIWKSEIERKLLVARVIDGVKNSVKKVTEWEASKHFIRNEEDYKVAKQVKASMIMVASEEEAGKVKARLKAGEDFAKLAKELSISPEGASGGELGVFSPGEMPREFEEIVFKIPLRVPSEVVKTGYGYHIFLVRERKKGRKLRFENVKADIKARLMEERVDLAVKEWILALKREASIEILEEL